MATEHRTKFFIILLIPIILSSLIALQFRNSPKTSDTTDSHDGLRIISLAPNITEILFALDLADNVVGVTSFCNYPRDAKNKPIVGSTIQINLEKILTLRPTVIFSTSSHLHQSFQARLEEIGCRSVSLNVETLDDIYAAIETIARICDKQKKGSVLVENIRTKLSAISQKAKTKRKPKVLIVIQQEPLIVAANGTYIGDLIKTLGAVNAVTGVNSHWPQINSESLILFAPEIIIEARNKETLSSSKDNWKNFYKRWKSIPAVKNDKIYSIDADIISRPGPRVVKTAEILYSIIYGENKEQ